MYFLTQAVGGEGEDQFWTSSADYTLSSLILTDKRAFQGTSPCVCKIYFLTIFGPNLHWKRCGRRLWPGFLVEKREHCRPDNYLNYRERVVCLACVLLFTSDEENADEMTVEELFHIYKHAILDP